MTISVKNLIRNTSIVLLGTLFLSACDPSVYGPNNPRGGAGAINVSAAEYARRGNHAAAARAYRILADKTTGIQRDKYLLEAAHQWFALERYNAAQDELAGITTLLDSESQIRKILLQTRVLLELNQAPLALTYINTLNPEESSEIARSYHLLKGRAFFDLGRIVEGTKEFLSRELFTRNMLELQDNRDALWFELKDKLIQGYPLDLSTEEELVTGWILLAQDFSSTLSPRARTQFLQNWRENYPNHPAYTTAVNSLSNYDDERFKVGPMEPLQDIQSVAVLVPLSGRFARAGEIIRRGIQSANRRKVSPVNVLYFDTEYGAVNAYQQALSSQVDAVIGPLSKDDINAVSLRLDSTPTLALNRIDDTLGLNGLLQFGLAPEDEAALAAQFALAQGYTQAVTLTAQNAWGQRILSAFENTFIAGGGSILEQASYSTRDNDHSVAITGLLNLDESKQRFRQVSYLLGADIEYEARRRLDVDLIFLAAQAKQARLIRPQLKFHYASRIPVFATSHSYDANPIRNKDINDIQLTASEWLVNPVERDALLADELNITAENPGNSQIVQLFSLGFDALNYLEHLSQDPQLTFSGLSGELSIDEYGVIHRNLPLAIIRNGNIELIQEKLEQVFFIPTPMLEPQDNVFPENNLSQDSDELPLSYPLSNDELSE